MTETKKKTQRWNVYAIDLDTRRKTLLSEDLSKRDVLLLWKMWDEKGTRSFLTAEPRAIRPLWDIYCLERDGRFILAFQSFTKRQALSLIRWNDQDCSLVMWPAGVECPQAFTLGQKAAGQESDMIAKIAFTPW